ncbi:MAG: hypothetical protein JWN75_865 [Candidatus Saccharibacteria bacterium]|nr:hypothetical protein [Candidatus Saccharibacteria bacterium]
MPNTSEKLTSTLEQDTGNAAVLPVGTELSNLYELELGASELPTTYRLAGDSEKPNVIIYDDDGDMDTSALDIAELQSNFIRQTSEDEASGNESWWQSVADSIKRKLEDPDTLPDLLVRAKHTAEIVYDGRLTGQNYEVFEMGDELEDETFLETTFETLELIDQLSGGLLSTNPHRPRVVLMNGIEMKKTSTGKETMGFASEQAVVINVSSVYRLANETGANPREVVAVILVHEILGHATERITEEKVGDYFPQYFDYSDEKVNGATFNNIHKSITPKDTTIESSPVREYGRRNSAEDLATSVEVSVADSIGWNKAASAFKHMPDEYRRDLVMQFMDRAAKLAAEHIGTPGSVSSEIAYRYAEDGKISGVEPKRKFEITTIPGDEAVSQEIAKVVEKHESPKEFIVSVEEPVYG